MSRIPRIYISLLKSTLPLVLLKVSSPLVYAPAYANTLFDQQGQSIRLTLSLTTSSSRTRRIVSSTQHFHVSYSVLNMRTYLVNVVRTNVTPPIPGILGLGPNSGSNVHSLINASSGDNALDRIFRQNMTTPNFISFNLPRVLHSGVEAGFHTGQLTIGAIIPGQEAILNAAKLPALVDEFGVQHWQSLLDANGIIGPDGERINTETTIEKPLNGTRDQLHVVFDSGFTLPPVPRNVADAIYGRVPNASFIAQPDGSGAWQIPCDYELSISFVFAGVQYSIAPLDMSFPETFDDAGNPTSCVGSVGVSPFCYMPSAQVQTVLSSRLFLHRSQTIRSSEL